MAIDFEKNGENVDPTFNVSIKLETIEVTYYHVITIWSTNVCRCTFTVIILFQHAMMEIIQFFKLNNTNIQTTILWSYKLYEYIKGNFLILVDNIVSQTLRINFKIDIKGPYIVFPEHGSIQKCVLYVTFIKVYL